MQLPATLRKFLMGKYLSHRFGAESAQVVVATVLLCVALVLVMGAYGSGKSTLLKLMSRLLLPMEGTVFLDGKEIHNQSPLLVAQKLALLPQEQTVPSGLTVWQLVALGRAPHQPWWQWQLKL